jgi:hypothetical protein
MSELDIAKSLVSVLQGSRWIGVNLAQAFVDHHNGAPDEDVARVLYSSEKIGVRERLTGLCRFEGKRLQALSANCKTSLFK